MDYPASPLAFGGGSLMGRMTARESMQLVHVALSEGVRHFDTARLYSHGESELVLGRALRDRDDVTITTKVGLGAATTPRIVLSRNAVLRRALRARDRLRGGRDEGGARTEVEPRATFDLATVLTSIDTSRRLLRRDVLDCLLLHEVDADQVTPRLLELADSIVDRGLAVRVGIATRRAQLQTLVAQGRVPGTVVQLAGGPLNPSIDVPRDRIATVHSLFGAGGALLNIFTAWVAANPPRAATLGDALGVRPTRSALASAVLRAARAAEPNRTVIISSRSVTHLAELCRAAQQRQDPESTSVVLDMTREFVAERQR